MKKIGLAILVVVLTVALPASAKEWSKTYNISGWPDLRIETTDANIHVDTWDQKTIEATVVSSYYDIGPGGVQIEEHQTGDTVEINVRLHHNFVNINFNHRLDVNIHMPRKGQVNLHTGDGKIEVANFSGDMELRSGDGSQEVHGVEGRLRATTGDGHINADGKFDALTVKTGDGHVDVRAAVGSTLAEEWMLHTGDGSVRLQLPDNLAADLYLHTGDGHIDVDLPMTTEGRIRGNDVHGKMNGGGKLITVHTGDGSISLGRA